MTPPRVALATCLSPPERDADEALLLAALRRRGVQPRMLAWDNPERPAVPGEPVVIRSTWNYYRDVAAFLAWASRVAAVTRLWNPASVVRANAQKTYLRDFASRGVAVVPTEYATRGRPLSVAEVMRTRGWSAIVVKPVVSAGSFRTRRFEAAEIAAAQTFLDELASERDAMIQRWMPSVDGYGERSLVWIDGTLTHAIRKAPRFAGTAESVSTGTEPIDPRERAFAEALLAPFEGELLYARVDVVWDDDTLGLMKLELIEPSLFLAQCPAALDRLADAIVRHASAGLA